MKNEKNILTLVMRVLGAWNAEYEHYAVESVCKDQERYERVAGMASAYDSVYRMIRRLEKAEDAVAEAQSDIIAAHFRRLGGGVSFGMGPTEYTFQGKKYDSFPEEAIRKALDKEDCYDYLVG